jgi:hypothetical protein
VVVVDCKLTGPIARSAVHLSANCIVMVNWEL